MGQIRLSIDADTVDEFDELIARFSRSGDTSSHVFCSSTADEARAAANGIAAERENPAKVPLVTPAARRRAAGVKGAAPTQNPDGTPIAPIHEPTPQPTPGGTDAPPAESIPPNQGNAGASESGAATAPTSPTPEVVAATPAATSPEVQAAQAAGEITVQNLKDAMSDLLKAKSASFAMETLFQASGCKSLTTGSPSVVEKAKDDPSLLRTVFDALVTAKA